MLALVRLATVATANSIDYCGSTKCTDGAQTGWHDKLTKKFEAACVDSASAAKAS